MFGMFKKAETGGTPPLRRAQLQPRIKHPQFLKALQAAGVPQEQLPATTALCGELLVTYAFDLDDSFMVATPALLAQAGVGAAELAPLALANLLRVLPQPEYFTKERCGLAYTGHDLEATLLLVDAIWDQMQPNFAGEIVVTAPRRDRLLMCDSADVKALASLRLQSAEFFNEHDDAHRLSTQLMVRRAGAWSLFDGH